MATGTRAVAGRLAWLRPEMRTFARMVDEGLRDRLGPPAPDEEALVGRLIRAYRLAKEAQRRAPPEYQPDTIWGRDLDRRLRRYLEALERDDVPAVATLLGSFLRNEAVTGLWTHGYYGDVARGSTVDKRVFAERVIEDAATLRAVGGDGPARLEPPGVGNPWGVVLDGRLVMPVSPRHRYYADRAQTLLGATPDPVVVEIGGGFGGFAYFLLSDRPDVRYVDFDLPEVVLLIGYYLLRCLPERRALLYGEAELDAGSLDAFDIVLAPNFELRRLADRSANLVVCTASLSEMDETAATEYVRQIRRLCGGLFLHENLERPPRIADDAPSSGSDLPLLGPGFACVEELPSPWTATRGRYREYVYARAADA